MLEIIKKHYILFSICFVLFLVIIGLLFGIYIVKMKEKSNEWRIKKDITISNIKTLYFSYSTGTAVNSNVRYELKYENDKYYLFIKPNEVSEEDALNLIINKAKVKQIEDILNEYKVERWNGFSKSDKYVLDGDSFSFSVHYGDDKSINASGYMMYPRNYREVKNKLDSLFMAYYEEG